MGELEPTRPIETTADGKIIVSLYGQDGRLVHMTAKDTPDGRRFVVWLRKFDRYGKGSSS